MYKVEIPDLDYFQSLILCRGGCPVNTDARAYVIAIAEGNYEKAYRIARESNPFASICGRICGAPCEAKCRRGNIDQSIAIRALKRLVTEKYGVESGNRLRNILFRGESPNIFISSHDITAIKEFTNTRRISEIGIKNIGDKVAIIGSGPAGMSAAHDLALLGYKVTVFEKERFPGGMLYFGVPEYRLPRKIIEAEIYAILSLGVELKLNIEIGKDITISDLINAGYKSILIAVGANISRPLPIEGIDLPDVLKGIEYLKKLVLKEPVKLGERVIVIGGGNVAYDVARSTIRKEEVKEVHVVCLESLEEMPADDIEIEEGEEEGIILHNRLGPKRILSSNGKVTGVEFLDVERVFDEEGRFDPKLIPDTESRIECDTVILSIGQACNLSFINESEGIETLRPGVLKVDPKDLSTTKEGIFAAGDVAYGPKLIIDAVASGKKAALHIDEYIKGKRINISKKGKFTEIPDHEMIRGYEKMKRAKVPTLSPYERKDNYNIIEIGFDENMAKEQSSRCLRCHIETIFDGEKCILCAGCVDVCPEYCLKLVSVDKIEGDGEILSLYSNGSAIIKDESRCIRCGLCAKRCPADAITMEYLSLKEELFYE
jgi:NADPH-dependent glutamate synthase beta subunit-like oxidoreductase